MNTFERDGISFRYPTDWTAEIEEDPDGGWSVTVSSPDTAFFLASLQPEASDAGGLADQVLDSLKEVYSELDFEDVTETICGLPAVGSNADFLTADTAVVCRVRGLDTYAGPLLLLAQVSEFDRERNDPVLQAIAKSLDVDTDR